MKFKRVYAIKCKQCFGLTYNATIRHCPLCSNPKVKILKEGKKYE